MSTQDEKDIEYILRVIAHPEMELTAEFRMWMQDKEHRKLYKAAKAAHDAIALKEKSLPDTQEEWQQFLSRTQSTRKSYHIKSSKHTSQSRNIHAYIWSAAASLALLIGFSFWAYHQYNTSDSIALMEANLDPQEIVLSSNSGQSIVIDKQTNTESVAILGASISDEQAITYKNDKKIAEAAPTMQTLQTPRGKDFKIELSDGTIVWLNAESKLQYPSRFTGKERLVHLEGEAYFKVAKDAKHPFIVKTANLETHVLGTGFNLRSYNNAAPHVTLVEGKVAVKSEYYHIMLRPGEDACLNADGSIQVQKVNTQSYTAWTEGYFYFDNASLDEIMKEIGRWYNLSVHVNKPEVLNYHFNFWAKRDDSIEHVIKLINELDKVNITIEGNKLIVN